MFSSGFGLLFASVGSVFMDWFAHFVPLLCFKEPEIGLEYFSYFLYTYTHTKRERERERGREKCKPNIKEWGSFASQTFLNYIRVYHIHMDKI
jgi:hypothetical protein